MSRALIFLLCIHIVARASFSEDCNFLLDSPPRGMSCFYCMHPNAPGQSTPIVDLLLKSCISDVALSFVTDGSFGYNKDAIVSAIDRLTSNGRTLWLHLYLYNGPAQRRWRSNTFKSFAIMDPILFRSRVLNDKNLQRKIIREVKKIQPILSYAKERGVKISLAPGLEDNLDNKSFAAIIKIIRSNLPENLIPKLVRSNCGDCTLGNQSYIPKGVFQEVHTAKPSVTANNGIVTNDGDFVRFKNDPPYLSTDDLTINDLLPVMEKAGQMSSPFHLWIPKYQDSFSDNLSYSPDARTYKKPTRQEEIDIIQFLTYGL